MILPSFERVEEQVFEFCGLREMGDQSKSMRDWQTWDEEVDSRECEGGKLGPAFQHLGLIYATAARLCSTYVPIVGYWILVGKIRKFKDPIRKLYGGPRQTPASVIAYRSICENTADLESRSTSL